VRSVVRVLRDVDAADGRERVGQRVGNLSNRAVVVESVVVTITRARTVR